ncbi:tripartite ATP-independent transporter DctP family solute receptor [Neorhizobium galegae]|uniref:TRAP transporter substrate-binding protein n=1 Tax=Neorhizobium galegae TaxID=399 RepID=UPI002786046D|nr:TRAP transporter substrate-binding protein [Neorhizobium galegae]MDQ0137706.1 tripartite ATP-independent transporter DctP family solute receptor [Neorhizobium galegae]
MEIKRRSLLAYGAVAAAGIAAPAILTGKANAAEFKYRMVPMIPPGNPLVDYATEAAAKIQEKSGGRLEIQVFPGFVLGSPPQLQTQLRTNAIQFLMTSGSALSSAIPRASILQVPYAFNSYKDLWPVVDSNFLDILTPDFEKLGFHRIGKVWDIGFRHVTTSKTAINIPDDLKGLKIRVPSIPLVISLFEKLQSSPTPLGGNELYSALQTHLVDGQENGLVSVEGGKFYEVQKHCSLTGHQWEGYMNFANPAAWAKLPDDLKELVVTNINAGVDAERAKMVELETTVRKSLEGRGMVFTTPDREAFRNKLKASGFYTAAMDIMGKDLWAALEAKIGPLRDA